MLKRLRIDNYLLIESLDIEFNQGLNIITGETGAGKSILLGAISMLLGAKADLKSAKIEGKNCTVEATFSIEKFNLSNLFAEHDVEYDDETIISRVILPSGKSRAYINDLPVSLSVLKIIGERLVDIHSQHQTLLLTRENFQIDLIDSVARNSKLLTSYLELYNEIKRLKLRLSHLEEEGRKNIADHDYIKFQFDELEAANIKIGELTKAENQYKLLSNASLIKEIFYSASEVLDSEETSIISNLKNLSSSFDKISEYSPLARSLNERLTSVLYELKDINSEAYSFVDRIDDEPQKLEQLEQRINTLNKLLLKHSVSNETALVALREDYEQRLINIDLSSSHIEKCREKLEKLNNEIKSVAAELTKSRTSVVTKIESYVEKQLKKLGMESSRFKISIEEATTFTASGSDEVKFMFSANKGVDLNRIEKVVSGGEMSRIMLSLKSLSAMYKSLPTIIFDEIDTGVSGNVADKMGEIMHSLSNTLQTICITHLPQVASKGESHFVVKKIETKDNTQTSITSLNQEQRIEVIAKMISGSKVTDMAMKQAELLLAKS
ncbi:MAG: DNA repair protein RecN [Rikenellaceae bacterium]